MVMRNSPTRKMRRPIASRLLIQSIAFWSRQIKRDTVFVTCVMISECVDGEVLYTRRSVGGKLPCSGFPSAERRVYGTCNLAQSPKRLWLRFHNRLCVGMLFINGFSSRLSSDLFQQARQSCHDLWLS